MHASLYAAALVAVGKLLAAAVLSTYALGASPATLFAHGNGRLWTVESTGALASEVGHIGWGNDASLVFDPLSDVFFGHGNGRLWTLDPTNAAVTEVGYIGWGCDAALAFDPSSGILFAHGNGRLWTLDKTNAAATEIGHTGWGSDAALAFRVATVPEPGTLVLLVLGCAGLAATRRRRRRQ